MTSDNFRRLWAGGMHGSLGWKFAFEHTIHGLLGMAQSWGSRAIFLLFAVLALFSDQASRKTCN